MPLTKTNTTTPIRGYILPNQSLRFDCHAVIALLQFADLGRGSGNLHIFGKARLDMQGHTASGDANIQVQIGDGTTAAVLVATAVQNITNPTNQRGAANAVISALNQSLDSGTIWTIAGTLP